MSKKSAQSKDASKSVSKDEFDGKVVPSLQESVISRTNSDNTVSIVNLELDDVCYSLDGIAAEIWTQIDLGKMHLAQRGGEDSDGTCTSCCRYPTNLSGDTSQKRSCGSRREKAVRK